MPEFDFSEGYTRLEKAMAGGSEVMPFVAQMHEFAMKQSGAPGHRFYSDAETFVRGICETTRDFRFDVPSLIWDVYNVEAEALGAKLVLFDDMAPAIDNVEPIITDEKSLARLKSPNPATAGRMPFVQEVLERFRELTGRAPQPGYCAPFTLAAQCMTFERLIYQIRDNPAFVHKVMTFLTDEVLVPYMNHMARAFPDAPVLDGSDAVASLPFITADMQEEFALHYIERMQRQCSLPVVCDNWWGDSYATDLEAFWRLKLRATPTYLKVQDPDLFRIGAEPAHEYARKHDLPLVLGVDNNVLQNGPAEEIGKRIHEYMEIGEPGGKTILYLCSLSAETPEEHVRAAVGAIGRFRAGDRPWAGLRLGGGAPRPDGRPAAPTGAHPIARPAKAVEDPATADQAREELLDDIFDSVMDYDDEASVRLVTRALADGVAVKEILDDALISAMDEVGAMFSEGTIFVPEMLMAARAMKSGLGVLRPVLTKTASKPKGTVMLATVQGDVHDIGKNLVGMMLEGAGYSVVDLGVNQTKEDIVARAEEIRPDVIGLSALLTTSMPSMGKTLAAIREQGLNLPVVVGGAPVTQEFADAIGADGYGENAPGAVALVEALVSGAREPAHNAA